MKKDDSKIEKKEIEKERSRVKRSAFQAFGRENQRKSSDDEKGTKD